MIVSIKNFILFIIFLFSWRCMGAKQSSDMEKHVHKLTRHLNNTYYRTDNKELDKLQNIKIFADFFNFATPEEQVKNILQNLKFFSGDELNKIFSQTKYANVDILKLMSIIYPGISTLNLLTEEVKKTILQDPQISLELKENIFKLLSFVHSFNKIAKEEDSKDKMNKDFDNFIGAIVNMDDDLKNLEKTYDNMKKTLTSGGVTFISA